MRLQAFTEMNCSPILFVPFVERRVISAWAAERTESEAFFLHTIADHL